MKTFALTLLQGETSMKIEYQLNENQAKDMRLIVGTAINAVNQKLIAAKGLGAKILALNKPCDVVLSADGVNIDTRLLDAGIIGAKKEFKFTLTPSATPARQQVFAKKVWFATQLLLMELKVVSIETLIGQTVKNAIIEAPKEENALPPVMGGMQVAARTVPGNKEGQNKKRKPRKNANKQAAVAEVVANPAENAVENNENQQA